MIFSSENLNFVFNKQNFCLRIEDRNRNPVLQSREKLLGFSGQQTMFQFYKNISQPFWGFGSKTGKLNKEGEITKMWNVAADHSCTFDKDNYDPGYVSIPFFITKVNDYSSSSKTAHLTKFFNWNTMF